MTQKRGESDRQKQQKKKNKMTITNLTKREWETRKRRKI